VEAFCSFLPHAKLMHRLRPKPSSTDFSELVSPDFSSWSRILMSLFKGFSIMGIVEVTVVGGRGGEIAGLAILWPSSLVSSAVEATLGLLHVEWVLKVRGGAPEEAESSSSVCSASEWSWRVNKDSLL
jgi:hypothetical protein